MRTPLLSLMFILCCMLTYAQQRQLWTETGPALQMKGDPFQKNYKPQVYKMFKLDEATLRAALRQAPAQGAASRAAVPLLLTFPNDEGKLEKYQVEEASVMHPDLAKKYPDIRSYAGKGIDDPTATIRFDVSPLGFNGMILSAERKTVYINPVDKVAQYYIVFSRKDAKPLPFKCLTKDSLSAQAAKQAKAKGPVARNADDGQLRTFRLALAATGEYSRYFLDGTEPDDHTRKQIVLASMNTLMTRVNALYERDFGIRMVLVPRNDEIIFLNPATDPWEWDLNGTTQETIDTIIGDANYDIGHLVAHDYDNGNAGCIGCVCTSGRKGSGFTSHNTPVGDPFIIDYLTHEMGHQFGANHTFSTWWEASGFQPEPGSGSTIMGYAGITGPVTDVQPHSDDYFHAVSIQQITDYIKPGGFGATCAVATPTGNNAPLVSAGRDYQIPRSTPFMLKGKAIDTDNDPLTYTWEQVDDMGDDGLPGFNTVPDARSIRGPVFRSYKPVLNPARMFPRLPDILSGRNASTWEVLPAVQRTLRFRLTARDNKPGGGASGSADIFINIDSTSGPFRVKQPQSDSSAVVWGAGTRKTVTWDVARTNARPINCQYVNVLLSTDGGYSFTDTLAALTPNDGKETITVPNRLSSYCRIKVEAVANVFFDISNSDFIISPVPSLKTTNITANSATFNWNALEDVYTYQVSYKLKKQQAWIDIPDLSDTSVTVSRLYADSLYEWQVRALYPDHFGEYGTASFRTAKRPDCQSIYDNPVNHLSQNADKVPVNTTITGIVESNGDVDFYRLDVDTGSIIALALSNLPADYDLSLHDKTGKELDASDNREKKPETISRKVAKGTYYAKVFPKKASIYNPAKCYALTVISIRIPTKGNGRLASAEQTDTTLNRIEPSAVSFNAGKRPDEKNALTVFPNPAGSEVSIRYPALKRMAYIRIYDLQGKLVHQQLTSQPNTRVSTATLPPGTYIISVQEDGKKNVTTKLIRQ